MDYAAFLVINKNLKQTKQFHYLHHYLQLYRNSVNIYNITSAIIYGIYWFFEER